jgi:hypothetical protein
VPPNVGLGYFSLFLFSSFDFEHHCIGFFFAQNFWILWIFFNMPQLCVSGFDD